MSVLITIFAPVTGWINPTRYACSISGCALCFCPRCKEDTPPYNAISYQEIREWRVVFTLIWCLLPVSNWPTTGSWVWPVQTMQLFTRRTLFKVCLLLRPFIFWMSRRSFPIALSISSLLPTLFLTTAKYLESSLEAISWSNCGCVSFWARKAHACGLLYQGDSELWIWEMSIWFEPS